MKRETTIELRGDYSHMSPPLKQLTMRPPRAKDTTAAVKGAANEAEMEITLMATLCGVSVAELGELEEVDYAAVQTAYTDYRLGKHLRAQATPDA